MSNRFAKDLNPGGALEVLASAFGDQDVNLQCARLYALSESMSSAIRDFAAAQERPTERSDSPKTSAVSAVVKPAK